MPAEADAASAASLAGGSPSRAQVTVFKRATDLHVPRSWGPGADLGRRPDRCQQVRPAPPRKDFGAPASAHRHAGRSSETPDVATSRAALWDPATKPRHVKHAHSHHRDAGCDAL